MFNNGFDYENFIKYLKELLESQPTLTVNPLETLVDYYIDYPPEDLDETDSDFSKEEIDRLAQKQIFQLQQRLSNNESSWLTTAGDKWKLSPTDTIQEDISVEQTELYKQLTSPEKELLDLSVLKVDESIREKLILLYKQKVEKFGTPEERYLAIKQIVESFLYKRNEHESDIGYLSDAGELGRILKDKGSYKYYEEVAKVHRKNYAHDSSAEQFNLAIETAEECGEDGSVILSLTRAMRIQYELCGEEDSAATAFIKENDLNVKINGGIGKKIVFCILKTLSDYCQNPRKVALFAASLIISSAFIYCFIGVTPSGGVEQSLLNNCNDPIKVILDSLYFSVVTFTTLGYGDFSPSGFSRLMATIEALGGLFFTSLFLVTLVRKYGR